MTIERPVNQQAASDQIFLRHRPPITAVVTVVAVVAHGEVVPLRDGVGLFRVRQVIPAEGITAVAVLRCHHACEAETFRELAVDVEKRRLDPQLGAGRSGKPFDVKWRARFGISRDEQGCRPSGKRKRRRDEA